MKRGTEFQAPHPEAHRVDATVRIEMMEACEGIGVQSIDGRRVTTIRLGNACS